MQQNTVQYGKVSSIYPYYKPNDVFQRDQAYYDQLLTNTRRNQNITNSTSQRVNYQPVQTQYHNLGYQNREQVQTNQNKPHIVQQDTVFMNQSFGPSTHIRHQQSKGFQQIPTQLAPNFDPNYSPVVKKQHLQALQQNRKLKQKLDDLINYRDPQDQNSSQIVKKHHYNLNTEQGKLINQQEQQINNLLTQIKKNNIDVNRFKNAILQLQKSMNNIQSVDRQIYNQLKNLSNRDQELLNRATAALARGATREQVAAILERIIS